MYAYEFCASKCYTVTVVSFDSRAPFRFGSRIVPLGARDVGRELIASRVSAEEAVYESG